MDRNRTCPALELWWMASVGVESARRRPPGAPIRQRAASLEQCSVGPRSHRCQPSAHTSRYAYGFSSSTLKYTGGVPRSVY